ncbi:MAG: hypothetical protein ACTHLH_07235 [Solirubrobacterales bacterium]
MMKPRGRLGRVRRAGGCTIAGAVLLLTLPASAAAARPGDQIRPRSLHLTLASIATKGYLVNVETAGHHRVILNVSKGSQFASYEVRGKVNRHRIKADFGRFGRVSLRFHGRPRAFPAPAPRRKSQPQNRRCGGRRPERELGHFRGAVVFEGQRGFTRLAVGKTPGEVRRTYRQVCRTVHKRGARASISSSTSATPLGFTITVLTARSRVGGALTQFSAITLQAPLGVSGSDVFSLVSASLQERVGRIQVLRSTLQTAKPGAIRISPHGVKPAKAQVKLGSPFSGRAHYVGAKKGSPASWTGSLSVRLLGSGALPLTGPHFHTTLCRASAFNPTAPCFRQAEASIATAQGSGSHSHPLAEARLSSLR